jgi:predicted pyridoxine 5'-phosphate oxidase superfamily flavin-nucleotide-binding protein
MAMHYSDHHRVLQDRFDTRRLADALAELIVHDEFSEADQAFISTRDMFWLATIDHLRQPTVSYKGGAPGFVRVLDSRTLAFPCYDGNGMYYSMGNVGAHPEVGMLFMDFEKPHRLRVQGTAACDEEEALARSFPGAQFVIRVSATSIFQNCPRYVHRMSKVEASRYVPAPNGDAPLAGWKRIDMIQPVLPHYDQGRVNEAGGPLTIEEWAGKVATGDREA